MTKKGNQHSDSSIGPIAGAAERAEQLALKDRALAAAAEGIVIADARQPDMPLIYVNSGFERITGYAADSVLGRNCRLLQGPATDPASAAEIRRAIAEKRECLVEILNYRKDGTTFWNRLSITPVHDESHHLTHFIGVQSDITLQKNAEEELRQAKTELEAMNRRMKQELEMAAGIQRTMLPANDQKLERVDLCWRFYPCVELAGDTLNIIPLDNHKIAFYVIDVSGHGVASALLSVTLNRWLSSLPGMYGVFSRNDWDPMHFDIASPTDVARRLNKQFPMTSEIPQYFTMIYGILDQQTGEFRYASAGHPGAILIPKSGNAVCLESQSFPIGFFPEALFQETCLQLQPGDRLYLYTDGIPETANAHEEEFGLERCKSRLLQNRHQSLARSLDSLICALDEWRGDDPIRDDITLLGVEYRGAPSQD